MAKVVSQNIPPEITDEYDASLQRATEFPPGGGLYFVKKRNPFRIPHMQNPSFHSPSAAQRLVRNAFKNCTKCFGLQPSSGGATPPATGPRNRSWWYDESLGSGLFYYDYFIQQTWQGFFDGDIPDQCLCGTINPIAYNKVSTDWPDTTSSGSDARPIERFTGAEQSEAWYQFDLTPGSISGITKWYNGPYKVQARLHFWSLNVYIFDLIVGIWRFQDTAAHVKQAAWWDKTTLTWNNKPDIVNEAWARWNYMQDGPYGPWNQNAVEVKLDITDIVRAAIQTEPHYITLKNVMKTGIPNGDPAARYGVDVVWEFGDIFHEPQWPIIEFY